jgi:hypothetical protein
MTREELFEAALEACGGDDLALARALGYANKMNAAARTFARWRNGSGLDFEHTLKLLEIAGLLGEARIVRPEGHEEVALLVERQWDDVRLAVAAIERNQETLEAMTAALEAIDGRLAQLDERLEPPAAGRGRRS